MWVIVCYYNAWGVKNLDTNTYRPAQSMAHAEKLLESLRGSG